MDAFERSVGLKRRHIVGMQVWFEAVRALAGSEFVGDYIVALIRLHQTGLTAAAAVRKLTERNEVMPP